jgi:hypothetical protein
MKKIFLIFLVSALLIGMSNLVQAQASRTFRGADRNVRQPTNTSRNSNSFARRMPVRTFNTNRTTYRNNNSTRQNIESRNGYANQNFYSMENYSYRRGYNNYRNRYNYYGSNYYRNIYGRRTTFMYGPRYTMIPRTFISIRFGGNPYYYNGGMFYAYYSGFYQPIFPPFGIRIQVLPFGYTQFVVGTDPFFYYRGIYYRRFDNYYQVVDAPMGATVSSLPEGARSVIINGEKLYELNGTYYKADRDEKGNDIFIVVGKNGEVNNTDTENNLSQSSDELNVGDMISVLPEGSKVVTINGQTLYETPDHVYLQQETQEGTVQYKVVGK